MQSTHNHYHAVSDKFPPQIRPFIAAFTSYFLQASNDRNKNLRVKSLKGILWRLAIFLGYIDKTVNCNHFYLCAPDFPDLLIRDYITKENGIIMTSKEQYELFVEILAGMGYDADIYLYQQGHKKHIQKTNGDKISKFIIPVIRLLDGRLASTSIFNTYSFDRRKRELRIETQKECRERRIAKNKAHFRSFFMS